MTGAVRVDGVSLKWGESVRWDERRQRLYFVDCATHDLHWLEDGRAPMHSMRLPSMPTGVVPAEDGRLVVALDDGLHVVDPERQTTQLLARYPAGMSGRANDAAADLSGNLVTGTLNLAPGPGSYWWFSSTHGWRRLDDGNGNANGPVVAGPPSDRSLVIADTLAGVLYVYEYDGESGAVGPRRVFADISALGGSPDGACADEAGGIWTCVLRAGRVARYTGGAEPTAVLDPGVELPSDVTFGGPNLDRMYVTSIAIGLDVEVVSPAAGSLLMIDAPDVKGRPEPRIEL